MCGLAGNRTWIWSFGNSYTIHCTTRPVLKGRQNYYKYGQNQSFRIRKMWFLICFPGKNLEQCFQ